MYRLNFLNPHGYTKEDALNTGIYALRCIPNGRVYVGQTNSSFLDRWLCHQWLLSKHKHNRFIQRSFDKYGVKSFEIEILECIHVEDANAQTKKLNDREVYWIKHFREKLGEREVFNCNDGGDGYNPCKETREQISVKVKAYYTNPDNKAIISKRRKGKKKSELWKKKNSEIRRRLYETSDLGKKISESLQRVSKTPEYRRKCSENSKQMWETVTPELRSRMSRKGSHHSKDTCQHITNILKNKWQDPKYRMTMYRGRGIPETMVWIDFCLHDMFTYYPKLKKLHPIKRFQLFKEICKLHP